MIGSAQNVRVLIKRRWFAARPTAIRQLEQKADVLGEFAERNGPRAAKGLMLGLPGTVGRIGNSRSMRRPRRPSSVSPSPLRASDRRPCRLTLFGIGIRQRRRSSNRSARVCDDEDGAGSRQPTHLNGKAITKPESQDIFSFDGER
jgi:hypothetical protein